MKQKVTAIVAVIGIIIVTIIGVNYYNNSTPEGRLKQFYKCANSGDYMGFKSFYTSSIQQALEEKDLNDMQKTGMTREELYIYRDTQLIEHYASLKYEPVKTTYIDDNNVVIYQKVYRNNICIGSYNQQMVKKNGTWYLLH